MGLSSLLLPHDGQWIRGKSFDEGLLILCVLLQELICVNHIFIVKSQLLIAFNGVVCLFLSFFVSDLEFLEIIDSTFSLVVRSGVSEQVGHGLSGEGLLFVSDGQLESLILHLCIFRVCPRNKSNKV
jgi:hypothetical protein